MLISQQYFMERDLVLWQIITHAIWVICMFENVLMIGLNCYYHKISFWRFVNLSLSLSFLSAFFLLTCSQEKTMERKMLTKVELNQRSVKPLRLFVAHTYNNDLPFESCLEAF